MQVAWEALLVQARTNHNLVRSQWEGVQVKQDVTLSNRVSRRRGCSLPCVGWGGGDLPCQSDELLVWYHDTHGVAATAKTLVPGQREGGI